MDTLIFDVFGLHMCILRYFKAPQLDNNRFISMSVGIGIHFFCQDVSLNFTMNDPHTKWKCRMYMIFVRM